MNAEDESAPMHFMQLNLKGTIPRNNILQSPDAEDVIFGHNERPKVRIERMQSMWHARYGM
jgi:hypothetical protein